MRDFLTEKARKRYYYASILCMVLSSVFIVGWFLQLKWLVNPLPNGATMPFISAILFFVVALTIFLNRQTLTLKRSSVITLWLVLVIACIALTQNIFNFSLGINELLLEDTITKANKYRAPGRMTIIESLGFLILAGVFLIEHYKSSALQQFKEIASFILVLLCLLGIPSSLIQIIFTERYFIGLTSFFSYVLFRLLINCHMLKHPPKGVLYLFVGNSTGGRLAQKIVPFAIVLSTFMMMGLAYAIQEEFTNIETTLIIYLLIGTQAGLWFAIYQGYQTDIADKHKLALEHSLKIADREKTYFQKALENSSIFAILDSKWKYKYISNSFVKNFEYSPEELIGKPPISIQTKENDLKQATEKLQLIHEKKFWKGAFRMATKSGKIRMVEATIVAFAPDDKNPDSYQYLAVYHDVTKHKVNEELLAEQNKHLEQKNKEIEQFAYIASHDLQEPLRTIMNYSGILKEDYEGKFDTTADISLNYIEAASQRMSELIKGVLDYSRLGREAERTKTLIDCNKILHEVRADLQEKIKETAVSLEVTLLPSIYGYETELRLLFQNLILNGIKFRRAIEQPFVKVYYEEHSTEWLFKITDNGIGIKKEYLDQVFTIFKRLPNARYLQGTGIGLSHCQKIVSLHQGRIWVESTLGEGSVFYFTIPKANIRHPEL